MHTRPDPDGTPERRIVREKHALEACEFQHAFDLPPRKAFLKTGAKTVVGVRAHDIE